MPKITKPNMLNIWAEVGNVSAVPSEKISEGWIVEIPPYEQANFVENRQDKGLAYLLQQGIVEWDSTTEYQTTSYVQYNNVVYKSTGVNTNNPPDGGNDFWIVAFDDYGSAQTVQDQLDAIEADPDPFEQYLLGEDASKYGIKSNLTPLVSTNLNIIDDGAYEFDVTCTNKPFTSGKISQYTAGTVKHQFAESLDQGVASRSATDGVFTVWRYAVSHTAPATYQALQDQLTTVIEGVEARKIKVGDLYLTTNNYLSPSEVTAALGYGVWARFAQGLTLVGASVQPLDPAWTKTINTVNGAYEHTLLNSEMPLHSHSSDPFNYFVAKGTSVTNSTVTGVDSSNPDKEVAVGNLSSDNWNTAREKNAGGSQAFSIVQPSIVIGVWYRTD